MGRIYSATFEAQPVTAASDLFEVGAPSDAVVVIHSIRIGQSSDAGDAEAEMARIELVRRSATGNGTSITARPHEEGDAAFGGTVERNAGTPGASVHVIHADTFNVQIGWQYAPTPEERLVISPSDFLGVNLTAAPADSLTMSGTITSRS